MLIGVRDQILNTALAFLLKSKPRTPPFAAITC